MKIAVSILMNNEAPRLEKFIRHLRILDKKCAIYFWDDRSTDNSLETVLDLAEILSGHKITALYLPLDQSNGFDEKRNYIEKCIFYNKFDYVLHIDVDEQFDTHLLMYLSAIPEKEEKALTYAFPRLNLPNPGRYYPDYQVRLIKLCEEIEWRREVHETPYSIKHDKPVLKSHKEYNSENYLYCNILQSFPIVHHRRRTDIKRDWW